MTLPRAGCPPKVNDLVKSGLVREASRGQGKKKKNGTTTTMLHNKLIPMFQVVTFQNVEKFKRVQSTSEKH